jgi:hypothetical protein
MGSLVRLCAVTASTLVALSLVLFAIDQSSNSSDNQVRMAVGQAQVQSQSDIDRPNPDPAAERIRERQHGDTREYIDDANDVLVAPFTGIMHSNSVWAQRLVPAALGLLLYGLGGLLLANWLPASRPEAQDWRTAG